MRIQSEQFLKWVRLRAHGDTKKLSVAANVHYNTIANAWRDRAASPHIISVMDAFYETREKEISAKTRSIHTFLQ